MAVSHVKEKPAVKEKGRLKTDHLLNLTLLEWCEFACPSLHMQFPSRIVDHTIFANAFRQRCQLSPFDILKQLGATTITRVGIDL